MDKPIFIRIEMTDKEKDLSEKLLEAAIHQWNALKNTSPDSLRGSFLIRQGKLTTKGDRKWTLQVEQKGFDLLLDFLPWSISMIKLPWMTDLLNVEWR